MRRGFWAVVVAALAAVTACQGDDGGSDRPVDVGSGPAATSEPTAVSAVDEVQEILDTARLTDDQLGMAVDESYGRESGLQASTLAYCGDESDPADRLRTARSQRWWVNDAWPHPDQGGYTVGIEVVHYEPGGVTATMAAFQAVPDVCPAAEYASGARASFAPAELPPGLPEGSVALADEWTYPNGVVAVGLIVAIPAGDVVGFLYIRGDETAVHERAGELAATLAANVAEADTQISALAS